MRAFTVLLLLTGGWASDASRATTDRADGRQLEHAQPTQSSDWAQPELQCLRCSRREAATVVV